MRLPLILNKWFEATLTWTADEGLKFFVDGNLTASDKTSADFGVADNSEPFKLFIGSEDNGGGSGGSTSIDDVRVWSMAMTEEMIKRKSQGTAQLFCSSSTSFEMKPVGTTTARLRRGDYKNFLWKQM